MVWFHLTHVLLVILLSVSQVSRAQDQADAEQAEATTLGPATTEATAEAASVGTDGQAPAATMMTRRNMPYASAYQPRPQRPSYQGSQSRVPLYAEMPSSPMAPMGPPMRPLMGGRPMAPVPMPALPQMTGDMPSLLSSLTSLFRSPPPAPPAYMAGPPPGQSPPAYMARQPPPPASDYWPASRAPRPPISAPANPIASLWGLAQPLLGLLGPVGKHVMNLVPFGKSLMDIFRMARDVYRAVRSLLKGFSLSGLFRGLLSVLKNIFAFIPNSIRRVFHWICRLFSWIPRMFTWIPRLIRKAWHGIKHLFGCVFHVVPWLLNGIRKIPQRLERLAGYFYRLCRAIEMLLDLLKQAVWNGLRFLGNAALLPLRIITKVLAQIIYLPIRLLAEPVLALRELIRVVLYPFRRLCDALRRLYRRIIDDLMYLFGRSGPADYLVEVQPSPVIRVYPSVLGDVSHIVDPVDVLLP